MTWERVLSVPPGEGSATVVILDGVSILVGVSEGRPWAIEDRCSHAACAFSTDGEIEESVVICDCHGSEFDLFTGEVLRAPAQDPVRVFAARIGNDGFQVQL